MRNLLIFSLLGLLVGNVATSEAQEAAAQAMVVGTSVALEVSSTTGALLLPRMTTAERDLLIPIDGMVIYNSEQSKFQGYRSATGSALISQTDTTGGAIPQGIEQGVNIMYQSFTVPSGEDGIDIYGVTILTDAAVSTAGQFSVLNGVGVAGSAIFVTDISYTGCASDICKTTLTLDMPFTVLSDQSYTLKFEATEAGAFNVFTGGGDPLVTGVAFQNGTPIPLEDLYFVLHAEGLQGWVDLH